MSARQRAIARARARARDTRERLVVGKGNSHLDHETGELVQDTRTYLGTGSSITFNFSGGTK